MANEVPWFDGATIPIGPPSPGGKISIAMHVLRAGASSMIEGRNPKTPITRAGHWYARDYAAEGLR